MDTYLMLQSYVDAQIGKVLQTLASQPAVRANTVVLFTSDHGEYGGSHGMRGKGASAYEEAIHVPLSVRDFRPAHAAATAATGVPRTQLSSSVDVVGLLLSLATGSQEWRRERRYEASRQAPGSRRDLRASLRAGTPVDRARDRRGRHRVRDRTLRRRSAASRRRAAQRARQARRLLQLGARNDRAWNRPARNSSSTTTASPPVARRCSTAPARRPSSKRSCGSVLETRSAPERAARAAALRAARPRNAAGSPTTKASRSSRTSRSTRRAEQPCRMPGAARTAGDPRRHSSRGAAIRATVRATRRDLHQDRRVRRHARRDRPPASQARRPRRSRRCAADSRAPPASRRRLVVVEIRIVPEPRFSSATARAPWPAA